jgi:hypothetical protein
MDVTVELKRKRGEILDRLVEIREAQANLEAQMEALDQVIAISSRLNISLNDIL